jgi:hypothetical protein
MLQAVCLKISPRDEGNFGVFNGYRRGRVRATVKDRKFGDGASRLFHGQNLFSSVHRGLEDAHPSPGDDV